MIDPNERLGAKDSTPYESIRLHPFFAGVNFDTLAESTPPGVGPFIPKENLPDPVWSVNPNIEPGADRCARIDIILSMILVPMDAVDALLTLLQYLYLSLG